MPARGLPSTITRSLGPRDRRDELGVLLGVVEREAADDHEVGLVDRGARRRIEADAAPLRGLVELVARLAVGAVGDRARRAVRRGALDEAHAVVAQVRADAVAGLVVAEHGDERRPCSPSSARPTATLSAAPPTNSREPLRVAELVDEGVADDGDAPWSTAGGAAVIRSAFPTRGDLARCRAR